MALVRPGKPTDLEKSIGYGFQNRSLLTLALTHSSARSAAQPRSDNERLEFLGDRVLGLAVAELVSETFPDASEGDLARRFNRLVRGGTCALVANQVGLGPQLVLSDSESVHGGRTKETILADAMEAVLGAVFIESGFDVARGRSQVGSAGMGAGPRAAVTRVHRICSQGPRSCAKVRG